MTFSQIDKYHGVVCRDCNPYIDPLLVINKVLGYRTFFMCVAEDSVVNRSPNEFKEQWTENAICRREEELNNKVKGSSFARDILNNQGRNAHSLDIPDPHCTCGYYSLKKIKNTLESRDGSPFGHIFEPNFRWYNPTLVINSLIEGKEEPFSLPCPEAEVLELVYVQIVSKVSVTGKTIEANKGYRSEYITPEELMLVIDPYVLVVFFASKFGFRSLIEQLSTTKKTEEINRALEYLDYSLWNFVLKYITTLDKVLKERCMEENLPYTTFLIQENISPISVNDLLFTPEEVFYSMINPSDAWMFDSLDYISAKQALSPEYTESDLTPFTEIEHYFLRKIKEFFNIDDRQIEHREGLMFDLKSKLNNGSLT